MTTDLSDIMKNLPEDRRKMIEGEADKLQAEYLTMKELRQARELTQTRVAERLGVRQATVAQMEHRSDLMISTLRNYIEAMGGSLQLRVEFPGRPPVVLEHLGDMAGPNKQ